MKDHFNFIYRDNDPYVYYRRKVKLIRDGTQVIKFPFFYRTIKLPNFC